MPITPEEVGQSTFNWALWKLLDQLTARVLKAGESPGNGLEPAVEIDQAALKAAVQDLSDTDGTLVQALARLLGRDYASDRQRELALDAAMAGMSREQGLVLAAVVMYATQIGTSSDEQ